MIRHGQLDGPSRSLPKLRTPTLFSLAYRQIDRERLLADMWEKGLAKGLGRKGPVKAEIAGSNPVGVAMHNICFPQRQLGRIAAFIVVI